MKGSYSLFITEASLRYASVAYGASRQHKPLLLQRSQTSFDKEIGRLSRKKKETRFSADHLAGFLFMAHVSRRAGDWEKLKQYLRLFGEMFLEMQNAGLKEVWFESETTYIETVFSARGFRRAVPFEAHNKKDAFPYLDIVLEIRLEDCACLIENQVGAPKRSGWEKSLLTLMMYNQDILLTFKACFSEVVRAERGYSSPEQCRRRLDILRKRWADSENSVILERMKELDAAFITPKFAPCIALLPPDNPHCFNTGMDPVSQDLRCLGKLSELPTVSDELRETADHFKATCGGFRRLFWIRYLRNLTLLYILEKLVLGESEIEGVEAATKLCIILTDSLIQFPPRYGHLGETAQHSFSLAELVFRISPMTGQEGISSLRVSELIGVAWVRSLCEMTGVNSRPDLEGMPDWSRVNDIPDICDALLTRSHYWES